MRAFDYRWLPDSFVDELRARRVDLAERLLTDLSAATPIAIEHLRGGIDELDCLIAKIRSAREKIDE